MIGNKATVTKDPLDKYRNDSNNNTNPIDHNGIWFHYSVSIGFRERLALSRWELLLFIGVAAPKVSKIPYSSAILVLNLLQDILYSLPTYSIILPKAVPRGSRGGAGSSLAWLEIEGNHHRRIHRSVEIIIHNNMHLDNN